MHSEGIPERFKEERFELFSHHVFVFGVVFAQCSGALKVIVLIHENVETSQRR